MSLNLEGHKWKHNAVPQQGELERALVHMIKCADDDGSIAFLACDIVDVIKESKPKDIESAVVHLKQLSHCYYATSSISKYTDPAIVLLASIIGFSGTLILFSGEMHLEPNGILLILIGLLGLYKKKSIGARFSYYIVDRYLRKNRVIEVVSGSILFVGCFSIALSILSWAFRHVL
ncbi:hypothetical protein [Reinekea sp. G2M2-21]|uniref:hypothetical protein n=1 Tax=Reinekea sp. G2M2-21 TaxID=2788942 RepID=UPI0018AB1AB8|nr:hypothetical protein [Reinekea sp. G2M2-21]